MRIVERGSDPAPANSLVEWLQQFNLEPNAFMPFLDELGASSVDDLAFVEAVDVRALKMKPIPRNKFLAALATLTASDKEEL